MFSLLGAFQTFRTLTIISAVTIVLTAGYMLWVLQRVFLGTLPEKWQGLTDMNGRETFMLATLAVIVIFLGIYPAPILDLMNVIHEFTRRHPFPGRCYRDAGRPVDTPHCVVHF